MNIPILKIFNEQTKKFETIPAIKGEDNYMLAVRNGYTGTLAEWLLSLKGDTGERGVKGDEIELQKSATHVQWKYKEQFSWSNLIPLSELKGATGAKGADGKSVEINVSDTHIQWRVVGSTEWINIIALENLNGADGSKWFTGTTITGTSTSNEVVAGSKKGDFYLNSSTGYFYEMVSDGVWTYKGTLRGLQGPQGSRGSIGERGIQGEQGIQGIQGSKGDKGDTGAQGPRGYNGSDGVDAVFNSSTSYTLSGTNTFTAYDFITASDRRLKQNIKSISSERLIDKINFKEFTFISDKSNRLRSGFIAQEIEEIAPQFVYTDENNNKSISISDIHTKLISDLYEMNKELKRENKQLSNRLNALLNILDIQIGHEDPVGLKGDIGELSGCIGSDGCKETFISKKNNYDKY